MPEEISVQILSQASDNIQKLFDLSTRIDERVKQMQHTQESIDRKFEELNRRHIELVQKVSILESKTSSEITIARAAAELLVNQKIDECEDVENEMDKRIIILEGDHGRNNDRWNRISTFVIQLVWVILAAYMLTKLHLQAPAVP